MSSSNHKQHILTDNNIIIPTKEYIHYNGIEYKTKIQEERRLTIDLIYPMKKHSIITFIIDGAQCNIRYEKLLRMNSSEAASHIQMIQNNIQSSANLLLKAKPIVSIVHKFLYVGYVIYGDELLCFETYVDLDDPKILLYDKIIANSNNIYSTNLKTMIELLPSKLNIDIYNTLIYNTNDEYYNYYYSETLKRFVHDGNLYSFTQNNKVVLYDKNLINNIFAKSIL